MFQTLIAQIKEYKKPSILASLFMTLEVMFEISIPFVMANLLDKGVQQSNMSNIWLYGGLMLVCAFLSLFCGMQSAHYAAFASAGFAKNTLINRFYDIQSGVITYDGIDVKLIEKDSLRRSLGIVLQDTHLFTGTIAENIAYGRADATREEILEAARIANVDSFVQHLDNGYDTVLTDDGAGLSNGQRQLIAIARAALANAPVLILDEATSSIDSRTEKMVQEGMGRLMEGRTVFVIAHRLSTIVNSDVILVMDHGRIIERGDHDTLMEQGGIYYRLYTGGLEID